MYIITVGDNGHAFFVGRLFMKTECGEKKTFDFCVKSNDKFKSKSDSFFSKVYL